MTKESFVKFVRRIKIRCECCDAVLTEQELRIKLTNGSYANTCRVCLDAADIPYKLPIPFYETEELPEIHEVAEDEYDDYWNER